MNYEVAPFPLDDPPQPLRREMLLHCVRVEFGAPRRRFFSLIFLWCGSRRLKFINLMSNLNVKKLRRSIFVLDEALLNLATGVTSLVMTEPNLKVTKYRTKRQAAKAACLKVRLFNKSVKIS